jgi:F-type H+-transporting ATPase subunit alpha
VTVENIKRFEAELIAYMKDKKADVRKEVAEKKAIDDELKTKLTAAIQEFKKSFIA